MKRKLLMCLLLGSVVTACSARRASTAEDSWYTGLPTEGPLYWTWPELDRTRIHEVVEARELAAEELLQHVPIVALTPEEAAGFLDSELPEALGTKPYLTRGVYLNRETGSFSVYMLEDQLVVYHGSLGRSAVPMKRQTLILQLEREPTKVFVACSMAE